MCEEDKKGIPVKICFFAKEAGGFMQVKCYLEKSFAYCLTNRAVKEAGEEIYRRFLGGLEAQIATKLGIHYGTQAPSYNYKNEMRPVTILSIHHNKENHVK